MRTYVFLQNYNTFILDLLVIKTTGLTLFSVAYFDRTAHYKSFSELEQSLKFENQKCMRGVVFAWPNPLTPSTLCVE